MFYYAEGMPFFRPILEFPRLRAIVEDPEDTAHGVDSKAAKRLVLLNPEVAKTKGVFCRVDLEIHWRVLRRVSLKVGLPIDTLPPTVSEFATREGAEITQYNLDLDYDYWTAGHYREQNISI